MHMFMIKNQGLSCDSLEVAFRRAFVDVDPFNQDNCPRLLWASFAFVNNYLPYAGCVSYTWSMAVQMQFYVILPMFLLLCNPASPSFQWVCVPSLPKSSAECIFFNILPSHLHLPWLHPINLLISCKEAIDFYLHHLSCCTSISNKVLANLHCHFTRNEQAEWSFLLAMATDLCLHADLSIRSTSMWHIYSIAT